MLRNVLILVLALTSVPATAIGQPSSYELGPTKSIEDSPLRGHSLKFLQGEKYFREGNYPLCITTLRDDLRTNNSAASHHLLGQALVREHQFKLALSEFLAATELAPSDATYREAYKHALTMGEFCQRPFSDGVHRSDETDVCRLFSDAVSLQLAGKLSEAIAKLRLCLERTPDDPSVLFQLGLAYQTKRDWNSAISCYQRAYVLAPETFREAPELLKQCQSHAQIAPQKN
jgi:tetratricopeptide (TPR) repeat protein